MTVRKYAPHPIPPEDRTIAYAASRYSKNKPAFDDVIVAMTPNHADNTEITRNRASMLALEAMAQVDLTDGRYGRCPMCANPIRTREAKTCSPECGQAYRTATGYQAPGRPVTEIEPDEADEMRRLYNGGWPIKHIQARHRLGWRAVCDALGDDYDSGKRGSHPWRRDGKCCAVLGCPNVTMYDDTCGCEA